MMQIYKEKYVFYSTILSYKIQEANITIFHLNLSKYCIHKSLRKTESTRNNKKVASHTSNYVIDRYITYIGKRQI